MQVVSLKIAIKKTDSLNTDRVIQCCRNHIHADATKYIDLHISVASFHGV